MKVLLEKEAEAFLSKNGFPVIDYDVFSNRDEAYRYAKKIGFPVVLKIVGKLHKSDFKGVKVKVPEEKFFHEFDELKKISKKVMVQRYMEGKQIIFGIKKDPAFGHALLFGLGGIFVETLKDVSFRVYPLTKKDMEEMITEIRGYKILVGLRGEKPVKLDNLKSILSRLCKLIKKYKNIEELDINPVIANEKEARIVDARIVFS